MRYNLWAATVYAVLLALVGCAGRQHAVFVPDNREGRACLQKCLDSYNLCLASAEGVGKLIALSRCKEQLQRSALDCPGAFRNPEGELCAADCTGSLCARCPTKAELDAVATAARAGLTGEAAGVRQPSTPWSTCLRNARPNRRHEPLHAPRLRGGMGNAEENPQHAQK